MDTKQLQKQLQQKYDRETWRRVLESVFASVYFLNTPAPLAIANSQISECCQTGVVRLHDGKQIALFEARLDDGVHLLRNRVGVRNLMTRFIDETQTHGVLVVYDQGKANYRLTFVARESGITTQGEWAIFETASKRFTYVLGEGETCRTAAERLALLAAKKAAAGLSDVIDAFSVERLSKEFFTRYKTHYQAFVEYLTASNFRQSAFRGDEKAIRDFVKKLLGRIVFLHFLQKKGWLGATDNAYTNGDRQFMQHFWDASGKNEIFYAQHLTRLFFDALNNNRREQDAFEMPGGAVVNIPYLNGGLFDKDQIEERTAHLTFPSALFDALFAFFGEYNFTIDENDPEEREVGIDPEMLGHIFENLLEDNKDKGAFYTPKEIVQYMTQESLIEYLYAGLSKQERQSQEYQSQECQSLLWPVKASFDTPINTAKASFDTPIFETPIDEELRKPLEYFIRYKLKGDELPEAEQGNAAHFFRAQIAFMQQHGAAIDHLLDEVKICDPAIGSGAFPMGLLNEIYQCKILLNNTLAPADRAAIKRRIIERSIYGVDLEKGAVDIARLRFWLALIVEETTPTPLPNLDYKIVVGDSLISKFQDHVIEIKWDAQSDAAGQAGLLGSKADERKRDLLKRVTDRQRAFFHADAAAKPAIAQEIRALKIELLIAQLDAMIAQDGEQYAPKGTGKAAQKQMERFLKTEGWKQAKNALLDLKNHPDKPFDHFDWTLDFPEILNPALIEQDKEQERQSQECQSLLWPVKASFDTPIYKREPGFDIVIGNPPYSTSFGNYKDYFRQKYSTAQYQMDLYVLFMEKSVLLLKNGGILSLITPNSWLKNLKMSECRLFLLNNLIFRTIVLNQDDVFETASVDTLVFIAAYSTLKNANTILNILELNRSQFSFKHAVEQNTFRYNDGYIFEVEINDNIRAIFVKISENVCQLADKFEITRGINPYDKYRGQSQEIIQSRAYHATYRKDETFVPQIRGKHVQRYFYKWDGKDYISYGEWLAAPRNEKFFQGERIIFREILGEKHFVCALVTESLKIDRSLYIALPLQNNDLEIKYVLAILASKLMAFYFRYKSNEFDKLFPKIRLDEFKKLPIKIIPNEHQKYFVDQVDLILKLNQQIYMNSSGKSANNDIKEMLTRTDNLLDAMVCKLYGLTYDEARTVDHALSLTRADYDALAA